MRRKVSSSSIIAVDGAYATVRQWAETYGLPISVVKRRLNSGWAKSTAIRTPLSVFETESLVAQGGAK